MSNPNPHNGCSHTYYFVSLNLTLKGVYQKIRYFSTVIRVKVNIYFTYNLKSLLLLAVLRINYVCK